VLDRHVRILYEFMFLYIRQLKKKIEKIMEKKTLSLPGIGGAACGHAKENLAPEAGGAAAKADTSLLGPVAMVTTGEPEQANAVIICAWARKVDVISNDDDGDEDDEDEFSLQF
jgi:hypothetical protein